MSNILWHAICSNSGVVEREVYPAMEADQSTNVPTYRGISQWMEFQRDISKLTGLTFLATDSKSGYIPLQPEENSLCRFLQDRPGGCELCQRDCGGAVLQAAQKNEVVYYKCYGHLHNVAIPLPFSNGDREKKIVILGGRTFFSYQDFSAYRSQVREMGGDLYKLLELTRSLTFKERSFLEISARFIGRLAGSMVEQMAQADRMRDKVARLTTLFHISKEVYNQIDSPEVYRTILSTVGVLFDCRTAFLLIRRKETETFRTVEAFGQHADLLKGYEFRVAEGLLQRAVSEEQMVFSTDGYELLKAGFPKDTLSAHLFPIGRRSRADGFLVLLNTSLGEDEAMEVASFCSQVSLAIENRFLQEIQAGGMENLTLLTDLIHAMTASMDTEALYAAILEKAAEITRATQGSLMILNEETLELEVKATRGINRSVLQHLRLKAGDGIAGTVLRNGIPLVVSNVEEDERVMKANRPRYRGKSFVSFPLKAHQKTIGVLNLSDKEGGGSFSEEEVRILSMLTLYASVAVERLRFYQSSMDLRRISITDSLSGLLNRRYFEERLAEEIERAKRYGEPFSLIILDIDNFKQFNDTYGHLVGDEALRSTALGIRRCIRTIDIAARYGGEEFGIILPQAEKEDVGAIGERIRQEIEQEGISLPGEEKRARLTVSIGIAGYPADAVSQEDLIRRADRALYQAKALGKNRVVIFREE